MPEVSAIIPTYNVADWLKQSIASVLDQTFTDYELIIIDDGSTDNTSSVVKDFNDKRIRYFYKDNNGIPSSRNFGIAKAAGQYIAFLDSDDLWPKDYLTVMTAALEQATDYGVAYCAVTQVYPNGREVKSWRAESCVSGWITRQFFLKRFVWCQAMVVRRDILSNFYWDESLKHSADIDAILKISQRAQFLFVSEVEAIRRLRPESISARRCSSNVSCNHIRILERFYRTHGRKYLSKRQAMQRISHAYRELAKQYYDFGARAIAIHLFKQAISYDPFSLKNYKGLIKASLKSKNSDEIPHWQISPQLPEIDS